MTTVLNPITYTLDGWIGNTRDDLGVEWYVETTEGWWEGPGARPGLVPRESAHGAFWTRVLREPRLITLAGCGFARDNYGADAARDVINGLCAGNEETAYQLAVAEPFGIRTADVILADAPRVSLVSRRELQWQLRLTAPDPRKYGPWQAAPIQLPQPGSGGLDATSGLDASSGLNAGTGSVGGSALIPYTGNAPTGVLMDLTGPLPDATIRVPEQSVEITYADPISTGTVRINTDQHDADGVPARSAVLGGQLRDHMLRVTAGNFPYLAKGPALTWYFSSSGADPAALLTVRFRPAWW